MKIINNQIGMKVTECTQEQVDVVRTKIKKQESCRSWNTTRSMEDKEIRWLTASILQRRIWPEQNWEMFKRLRPPFPQKGDLRIARNYCGIILTSIAEDLFSSATHLYRTRNGENS